MSNWTPIFFGDNIPLPAGPYSPAVRAGDFVYVSGQTPRDLLTAEIVGSDIVTQSRQTLANVRTLLAQADASMADVVSMTVFLQDMGEWGAMNTVYAEFFERPFPTRTTVGVDLRGILVEISAVAYRPLAAARMPSA